MLFLWLRRAAGLSLFAPKVCTPALPDAEAMFKFTGRILGLALARNQCVFAPLASSVCALIASNTITLHVSLTSFPTDGVRFVGLL